MSYEKRLEEDTQMLNAMSYRELVSHAEDLKNERLLGNLKTSILAELKELMTREVGYYADRQTYEVQ